MLPENRFQLRKKMTTGARRSTRPVRKRPATGTPKSAIRSSTANILILDLGVADDFPFTAAFANKSGDVAQLAHAPKVDLQAIGRTFVEVWSSIPRLDREIIRKRLARRLDRPNTPEGSPKYKHALTITIVPDEAIDDEMVMENSGHLIRLRAGLVVGDAGPLRRAFATVFAELYRWGNGSYGDCDDEMFWQPLDAWEAAHPDWTDEQMEYEAKIRRVIRDRRHRRENAEVVKRWDILARN